MANTLIDTNVLLRYLLRDNEEMFQSATRIIKNGAFTLPEILAEVVYVLRGVYHFERQKISESLLKILDDVDVEPYEVMICAAKNFSCTNLDFVDCIILAHHKVFGTEIFTFDKKLNNQCKRLDSENADD